MRYVKVLGFLLLSFTALAYAQKSGTPDMDKDSKIAILQNEMAQVKVIWQQQQLQNQLSKLNDEMNHLQAAALEQAKLDPKEWTIIVDTQNNTPTFEKKPTPPAPVKNEAPKKPEPPK